MSDLNGKHRVVPATDLPAGATEGTWLNVTFDGDALATATIDQEKTEAAQTGS